MKPWPLSFPAATSSSESTDTLIRSRPAARSDGATLSRSQPLVVSATTGTRRSCLSIRMMSGRSAASRGSPPVNLTFSAPSETNARAMRKSSGAVMSWGSAQERMSRSVHLLRHAIGAAEIAPVGHRDAQIVHGGGTGLNRQRRAVRHRDGTMPRICCAVRQRKSSSGAAKAQSRRSRPAAKIRRGNCRPDGGHKTAAKAATPKGMSLANRNTTGCSQLVVCTFARVFPQ